MLVIGGGPVGLSAALFLAWKDVPTLLVERHPGSSPLPRAVGWTPRTMELFRAVGLADMFPQGQRAGGPRRRRVESLAGAWFEEVAWAPEAQRAPALEYSPCNNAMLPQDRLEPILRARATELGAELRLGTTLLHLTEDADGVTATLRESDGEEYTLRAAYVIAADGHRSPVREALGIGRSGRGKIQTARSVMFRADIGEELSSRLLAQREQGFVQYAIDQPGLQAFLGALDGRWLLIFQDEQAQRDEESVKTMARKALGLPEVPIELIATGRWEVSGLIADRFASGRVFLAGDAAHTLPPNRGGFGANTGIEDAHNLAWKLAAVLAGSSRPALLDSYDAERRPIAWLRHQQIFARPEHRSYAGGSEDTPIIENVAMELGQLYRSSAVLDAARELPPALRPEQWAGQPGTRAPHAWVFAGEQRVSTLDLFQRGWVLLTADERWEGAARAASHALEGIELRCLRIGADLREAEPGGLEVALSLEPSGATLIRPDGYIAWRATRAPADPGQALTQALAAVASAASATAVGP